MAEKLNIIHSFKKAKELFENGTVFCAVDTETTGFDCKKEHVIEISALKFKKRDAQSGSENEIEILENFSTLVKTDAPLPPKITEITKITDSMLSESPSAEISFPEFKKFAGDAVLVAHNAQFDIRFLNAELERLNIPLLKNSAVDTLYFSKLLLPESGCWKQPFLANHFGIEIKSAHRAFDDARVCMELFFKLIQMPVPKRRKHRLKKENPLEQSPASADLES